MHLSLGLEKKKNNPNYFFLRTKFTALLFFIILTIFSAVLLFLPTKDCLAIENYSDVSLFAHPLIGIDPNYHTGYLNSSWVKVKANEEIRVSVIFSHGGIPETLCRQYKVYIGINDIWKKASCFSGYEERINKVKASFRFNQDGNYGVSFYLESKNNGSDYEGNAGEIGVYKEEKTNINFSPGPTVYQIAGCQEEPKSITSINYTGSKKIGGLFIPEKSLYFWSDPTCPSRVPVSAYFGAIEVDTQWYNCGQYLKTLPDQCPIGGIMSIGDLNGKNSFNIRLIPPIFVCTHGYSGCTSNAFFFSKTNWILYLKGDKEFPAPSYENRTRCYTKNRIRYCCKKIDGKTYCWIIRVPPDKFYSPEKMSAVKRNKLTSLLNNLRDLKSNQKNISYQRIINLFNKLKVILK